MEALKNEPTGKRLVFGFKKIILASQSPRRKELLQNLTKDFEVVPSKIDEEIDSRLTPETNALTLAGSKALWVANQYKGRVVIGADTIVVLDGKILGKPKDRDHAQDILRSLGGRQHQVITGVTVVDPKEKLFGAVVISTVNIKPLTEEEISAYVQTDEPLDKAGGYAIQGKGAFMVKSYEGSYSNIVGLPLETLKTLLLQAVGTHNNQ